MTQTRNPLWLQHTLSIPLMVLFAANSILNQPILTTTSESVCYYWNALNNSINSGSSTKGAFLIRDIFLIECILLWINCQHQIDQLSSQPNFHFITITLSTESLFMSHPTVGCGVLCCRVFYLWVEGSICHASFSDYDSFLRFLNLHIFQLHDKPLPIQILVDNTNDGIDKTLLTELKCLQINNFAKNYT